MIADSLIVPECAFKPGSFTGLMTLYESSYLKLQQLLHADLTDLRDGVSHAERDCDLHLEILTRDRYTTTLRLTYWFESHPDDSADSIADPDLTLKICHDARLLEAVSLAAFHRHHKLREFAQYHRAELDRRWQRNMMLNKWLDYLLDSGHNFT